MNNRIILIILIMISLISNICFLYPNKQSNNEIISAMKKFRKDIISNKRSNLIDNFTFPIKDFNTRMVISNCQNEDNIKDSIEVNEFFECLHCIFDSHFISIFDSIDYKILSNKGYFEKIYNLSFLGENCYKEISIEINGNYISLNILDYHEVQENIDDKDCSEGLISYRFKYLNKILKFDGIEIAG